MRLVELICEQCKESFTVQPYKATTARFCSKECKHQYGRVDRTCEHCGVNFVAIRSNVERGWARYCSARCKTAAHQVDRVCQHCGKEFVAPLSEEKLGWNKFCSRKCYKAHGRTESTCECCGKVFAIHKSAVENGQGRFCSRKCQRKVQRVDRTCKQCGKQFNVAKSGFDNGEGIFCSRVCLGEWKSIHNTGENNPSWKGGSLRGYYGPNWRSQRRKARKRDKNTCQHCGITEARLGKRLDVHHITPFREFGIERYKEANRLSNLKCYCPSCHRLAEHGKIAIQPYLL